MSVSDMFIVLQGVLTADQDIREVGAEPSRAGAGRGGAGEGLGRGAWPDGRLSPQEIRKVVQALEQTAREILTLLQGVHQGAGFQDSEFAFLGAAGNSRLWRRGGVGKASPGYADPSVTGAPFPGFSRPWALLGCPAWASRRLLVVVVSWQLGGFKPDK